MTQLSTATLSKINVALRAAKTSTFKFQLGAAIFHGDRLIASGCNKLKTHTKSLHPHKMIHAEVAALLRAGENACDGAVMFVVRLMSNGTLGVSRPCDSCMLMSAKYNIRRIFFFGDAKFDYVDL